VINKEKEQTKGGKAKRRGLRRLPSARGFPKANDGKRQEPEGGKSLKG